MFCIQNFGTHNSFWLKGAERSALTPSLLRYSFVHSDPGVHIPYWTHRDIFKEISSVYLLDQTATFVCQYNSAVLAALLSLLASARAIACGCTLSSFTLTGGCASRRPLQEASAVPHCADQKIVQKYHIYPVGISVGGCSGKRTNYHSDGYSGDESRSTRT